MSRPSSGSWTWRSASMMAPSVSSVMRVATSDRDVGVIGLLTGRCVDIVPPRPRIERDRRREPRRAEPRRIAGPAAALRGRRAAVARRAIGAASTA